MLAVSLKKIGKHNASLKFVVYWVNNLMQALFSFYLLGIFISIENGLAEAKSF